MNTVIQVILLFTTYLLLFLAGALAGYNQGVKKGVQACMNYWEDENDKNKHNNSIS